MPLCFQPPGITFIAPTSCPPSSIDITGAYQRVGGAAGNAVTSATGSALPAAAGNAFDWISGKGAPEHWKGIGLVFAAVAVAIIGLVLFTGAGKQTIMLTKAAAG